MMSNQERITESLNALGACLRQQRSVKEQVLRRITEADVDWKNYSKAWYRSRPVKAVAGLAACLILVATLMWMAVDGSAKKAFAAAIASVQQARTFSCKEIVEYTRDGQKHVDERLFMFKEPDRERHEYLAGEGEPIPGEVTITHYGKRRHLNLNPIDKTASLSDESNNFVVNDATGELRLIQLDTSFRDQILKWRAEAVEDLGSVELDGQSVRLLQSRQGENVIKVWIDPRTDLPVQIAIIEPEREVMYTSIQIDEELDDDLFSLEPPDGYSLFKGGLYEPWPEHVGKMYAKMRHLSLACFIYASEHDGQFPVELADLGIKAEVLKVILAAPDQPDGPPVIRYRQPRVDADSSTEIMLYELFDQWPDYGIAVGFADGHCAVITKERFEELMR